MSFVRNLLILVAAFALFFSVQAQEIFPVPVGFRLQVLNPTDGRIAMPEGWHHRSNGTQSGWLWTFSKEDPNAGPYETGLRIQLIAGIRKTANQSPKEFVQTFMQQKRLTTRVVSECAPKEHGHFTRQCLEVVEPLNLKGGMRPYRVSYSLFWSDVGDMVFVHTFGTPEELWEMFASTSKIMSNVQVIGSNLGH